VGYGDNQGDTELHDERCGHDQPRVHRERQGSRDDPDVAQLGLDCIGTRRRPGRDDGVAAR
jgi:hypothetical protein